jgi:hypothetical protein
MAEALGVLRDARADVAVRGAGAAALSRWIAQIDRKFIPCTRAKRSMFRGIPQVGHLLLPRPRTRSSWTAAHPVATQRRTTRPGKGRLLSWRRRWREYDARWSEE